MGGLEDLTPRSPRPCVVRRSSKARLGATPEEAGRKLQTQRNRIRRQGESMDPGEEASISIGRTADTHPIVDFLTDFRTAHDAAASRFGTAKHLVCLHGAERALTTIHRRVQEQSAQLQEQRWVYVSVR